MFDAAAGSFTAGNEAGDSDRQGAELEARWQLHPALELGLAYTYLDATEDTAVGRVRETRRARHIANASAQWAPLKNLSINLNIDYNGEQLDLFFPPTPPFSQIVELDDFLLVNLAASYSFSPSFTFFGRIENLLDEDYEEVFSFTTPGRSAVFGVRYQAVDH